VADKPRAEELSLLRGRITREQARELELVLYSQGMASWVVRAGGAFGLGVQPFDLAPAQEILRLYEEENRVDEPERRAPGRPAPPAAGALESAVCVSLAMAGFFALAGPRDPDVAVFSVGSADAARILAGELWRTVTALCLHADLAHLVSNVVFGSLFLTLVGRILGPGVALLLVITAGAFGNLVNAVLRSSDHVSIGASTAVFGAVGLLCGLGVMRWRHRTGGLRRAAVPVAAGVGLLAMLGSAEGRVDVFAHLFGFLAGIPLGLIAAAAFSKPPGVAVQLGAAACAAIAIGASWWLAFTQSG